VIGVVKGDRLVFCKAYGLSNVETGATVTEEMLFRLGAPLLFGDLAHERNLNTQPSFPSKPLILDFLDRNSHFWELRSRFRTRPFPRSSHVEFRAEGGSNASSLATHCVGGLIRGFLFILAHGPMVI
jgi:hypothetical protein